VPDEGELLHLEGEMRHFLALYPQVILCLYDVERFGGEIISSIVNLHPRVLMSGGIIVENPFYQRPNEVVASPNPDASDRSSGRAG
jgi:hypothetical protein